MHTCPSLLWLTLSVKDPKVGRRMLLGVSSLFKMHATSMHVDMVASLCTLRSGDTIWSQTNPYALILKPVSVSEIFACLIFIRLTNF